MEHLTMQLSTVKTGNHRLNYKLSNIYIPPWGVVILHIGVGMPNTNVEDHSPGRGIAHYYITYIGNITVEERYVQHP